MTFTIPADKLPSKGHVGPDIQISSIGLAVPTYGNYRSARRRHPSSTGANAEVSYSVQELLFALCMESVSGNKLESNPRDLIDRLEPFPIPDRQFLTIVFQELFFITADQAQSARDLAEQMKQSYKSMYVLPKGSFPVDKELSVAFRHPNTGVQYEADAKYQGMAQQGCSLEEFMMAYCLMDMNGQVIDKPKDVISVIDSLAIADAQYLNTVFINMFTMGDSEAAEAKKLAGDLRQQLTAQVDAAPATKPTKAKTVSEMTDS